MAKLEGKVHWNNVYHYEPATWFHWLMGQILLLTNDSISWSALMDFNCKKCCVSAPELKSNSFCRCQFALMFDTDNGLHQQWYQYLCNIATRHIFVWDVMLICLCYHYWVFPSLFLPLSHVLQLLSSMTECLCVDVQSLGVWRQLYTKHLPQSRSVYTLGFLLNCIK